MYYGRYGLGDDHTAKPSVLMTQFTKDFLPDSSMDFSVAPFLGPHTQRLFRHFGSAEFQFIRPFQRI